MYKKLLFSVLITGVVACSEQDLAYYQSNLDQAEIKADACNKAATEAFLTGDREMVRAFREDKECNAARQALDEHELELAEEAERIAQEQYDRDYESYQAELAAMAFTDFAAISQECGGFRRPSAKCEVYEELKEDKEAAEIDVLIETHGDSIYAYSMQQCQTEDLYILCRVSGDANKKYQEEKTDFYLANQDTLKSDYNECKKRHSELAVNINRTYGRLLYQEFTHCASALTAARELDDKVRTWRSPPIE